MARFCALNWAALIFALAGLIQTILIVLPGVATHVLLQNHFLTIDTSGLHLPATLSSSEYLRDLTTLTGTDLVGADTTPETLGLASTYTINLLTSCAKADDGTSSCTPPKFGYTFDPEKVLPLDSTSAAAQNQGEYNQQMDAYGRVSSYLAAAYVIAAVCLFLCTALVPAAACGLRAAADGAQALSIVATLLLFTASVAAAVKFGQLRDSFNAALGGGGGGGSGGITATRSQRVYAISFVAFVAALLATVALAVQARQQRRRTRQQQQQRHFKGAAAAAEHRGLGPGTNHPVTAAEPGKFQFVRRMTGPWNRQQHKYAQIEKQQRSTMTGASHEDHRGLVGGAAAVREQDSSDSGDEHGYSRLGHPDDIAMRSMRGAPSEKKASAWDRGRSNVSTTYDPYQSHEGGGSTF